MPLVLPAPALCNPIASVSDFIAWKNSGSLDSPETTADTGLIERVLCAATAWIESPQGCGRSFTLDTSDVTRTYYPYEVGRVLVDDLVTVTSIALDTVYNRTFSVVLQPSDYLLWPLDGPPYQEIRSWHYASHYVLPGQLVQVVGRAGFTNTSGVAPAAVQQACLLLAARWFERRVAPFGVIEVPSTGRMAQIAGEDQDVQLLLGPYVHSRSTWVVV